MPTSEEQFQAEFAMLPPEAQRMTMDFIAFLRTRYSITESNPSEPEPDITEEPFVGIWRSRQDMEDASEWLHHVRREEWRH